MLAVTGVGAACSKETKPVAVFMGIAPEQTGHFAYWPSPIERDEDLWDIYARFKDSSDAQQLGELVRSWRLWRTQPESSARTTPRR